MYHGRPCVVVTQDDGKVAMLSVKTGIMRYLFARPFVFWHTTWLPHCSSLLLASSEGQVLKIVLDDDTIARSLPVPHAQLLMAVRLLAHTPHMERQFEIRSVKAGVKVSVAHEERQERTVAGGSSGSDHRCFKDYVVTRAAPMGNDHGKADAGQLQQSAEVMDQEKAQEQRVLKLPPIQAALHRVVSTVLVPPTAQTPPVTLVLAAGRAGIVLCKVLTA